MLSKVTLFLFINLTILSNGQSFVKGLGNSSQPGQGQDGKDAHTSISYECTQSKRIKIMVTQDIPLTKLSVLKKNGKGEACKLASPIIDGCDYAEGDPVNLLLQDDVHQEVVGGLHSTQFMLTCNQEGLYTVQSAPGGINVQPPNTMTPLTKPAYHPITLSITRMDDQPVGSSVEVGQELKLKMVITDPLYVLGPKRCTAKGSSGEIYVIWAVKSTCEYDNSVIGQKWEGNQQTLEIKMYGFYFPTSTHVTIECETQVCLKTNKDTCENDCMIVTRRRRRQAVTSKNDTFSYEKSVQVAFDVVINEADVNSAIGILPKKPVFALMGITLYAVMQLI